MIKKIPYQGRQQVGAGRCALSALDSRLPSFHAFTKGPLWLGLPAGKGPFPNYYVLCFRFSRNEN